MIWILFIPTMAAARVKVVCHRYHQGALRSGLSGVEVTHFILRRLSIRNVDITHVGGMPGDHCDPILRPLVLSSDDFYGRTPAMGITTFASQILRWLPLLLGNRRN